MSHFASLEALLEHGVTFAKTAFAAQGAVHPMWICETRSGQIIPVVGQMPDRQDRDRMMAGIRAMFKQLGEERYAFIVEAWALHIEPGKGLPDSFQLGASLASHPGRVEVIQISAEDKERTIAGDYKILRPEHGPAKLSKFNRWPDDTQSEGRMVGLLR